MAEIKNSFLKSKMNKDLDDRLIPNGEYRDARNISVGKSEDDDIGALETVLGNKLMTNTNLDIANLEVIGVHTDKNNNKIFVFLTNNSVASPGTSHYIYQFTEPNDYSQLVTGSFLNFSTASPITGVSLIEDLLFFTDNRNQPRKINVTSALTSDYYKNEIQISVAKYNPYQPITLLEEILLIATASSTTTVINFTANSNVVSPTGEMLLAGRSLISTGANPNSAKIAATEFLYVISNTTTSATIQVAASAAPVAGDRLYFLATTMTGRDISPFFNDVVMPNATTWPGDPDYLEDRYVRFSYRFRFDDGEYSIMAPFTQIAFIPKQKGYLMAGNEDEAYRSTVLEVMENGVQDVQLLIPLPDTIGNLSNMLSSSYKIEAVDVLYKESDSRAVKVVDTIPLATMIDTSVGDILTYKYQSSKPFRTLPENQTVRVFDKVPVLALTQETAGNRVIYGNFKDKYTPPTALGYRVGVGPKSINYEYNNWSEYPNHSVKQNRNYQVGFILADKFGRQSSVILSSETSVNELIGGITYGGSTVYSPYNPSTESAGSPIKNWFGDALRVRVESAITDTANTDTGTPGLYANAIGDGFNVLGNAATVNNVTFKYIFTPTAASVANIPVVGSYLRGEFTDFVEVTITPTVDGSGEYTVTCNGAINKEIYELSGNTVSDIKYAYTLNEKGWYSYKVVVKQNEQEYYNVYLPGIVKGYPDQIAAATNVIKFPDDPTGTVSNIVLFNDNINKIPRDLTEVGPEQKQFRSSVQLYGRVENEMLAASPTTDPGTVNNKQFFPRTDTNPIPLTDTAISISSATNANMAFEVFQDNGTNLPVLYSTLSETGQNSMYQLDSNPLIARISTSQPIGAPSTASASGVTPSMLPVLAVYETEPVESLLDIYWETATAGLIADINAEILSNFNGPVGFGSYAWVQPEALAVGANILTVNVQPVDKDGLVINNTTLLNFTATNSTGSVGIIPANYSATTGGYNFKITSAFVFLANSSVTGAFTLTMQIRDSTGVTSGNMQLTGNLSNTTPIINGGVALPAITNNSGTSGIIATITGVNGSIDATNNTQQLQWSLVGANSAFTINATTGAITQTSATASVYSLVVRLTDANGATGSTFVDAPLQVTVSSTTVGYFFYGGPNGTLSDACPAFGAQPANCSSILYYSQSVLVNGRPTTGSVILQGSGGPGVSPVAVAGFYSIYQCATGADRWQMRIDNSNGIVASGYPKGCNE